MHAHIADGWITSIKRISLNDKTANRLYRYRRPVADGTNSFQLCAHPDVLITLPYTPVASANAHTPAHILAITASLLVLYRTGW
jgi:hypothetical protein